MKEVTKEGQNGIKFRYLVYESVEEGDRAAGREGAVLDECNEHLIVHGAQPKAWEKWVSKVEALTGVKRQTEQAERQLADGTTKTVEVITESKGKYVSRILAMLEAGKVAKFDPQAVADSLGVIPVDISTPVRTPKPRKVPKEFLDAAARIVAKGKERYDYWRERLQTENDIAIPPWQDGNLDANINALAVGIRERELANIRKGLEILQ